MMKKIIIVCIVSLLTCLAARGQTQALQVFNSTGAQIGPGKYLFVNFHVDRYLKRARLAGNIMARGGGGNDIVVKVVKDGEVLFDSGQQRSIVISLPLTAPGNYSLVLTNAFSLVSAKVVWGYVNLYSDGEDRGRADEEQKLQENRVQVARKILDQLYDALEAAEREWYTRQVPIKPQIVVTPNKALNAFADVGRNTIVINRAVFDAADSLSETTSRKNASSMLAGVIGHELAHLFYRHPGDRSSGLWGEIIGALPIDRKQEQQADVLGTRLACQVGYDPDGLAQFMKLLIANTGDRGDFGSTHPSSRGRIAMIQQVAGQCPQR